MVKEAAVVGVCIGVGLVLAKYTIDRKRREEECAPVDLKDFSKVLEEQAVVEDLGGKELSAWFKRHSDLDGDSVNKVIAYPTREMLLGLGYQYSGELQPKKSVIQFFYHSKEETILKLRHISFETIDTGLQKLLEDNEGMAVVE